MCTHVDGWKNAETHQVVQWIDSDKFESHRWVDAAQCLAENVEQEPEVKSGFWTVAQAQLNTLSDSMQQYYSSLSDAPPEPWMRGLLDIAINRVDWKAIAQHMIDKTKEGSVS
jgi:hypothetical protein